MLNGDIAVKVIDEAHNLEDKVRSAYTLGYDQWSISDIVMGVRKGIKTLGTNIANLTEALITNNEALFKELNVQIKKQIESSEYTLKDAERYFLNRNEIIENLLEKQREYLKSIDNIIQFHYDEERGTETMRQAVDRFDEMYDFFYQIVSPGNNLIWLEKNGKKVKLYLCPKDIAEKTKQLFFSDDKLTILTSATMTNQKVGTDDDKYSYFVRNTGFPNKKHYGFLSTPKPSPFPYDEHSKIFYASNLPNPRTEREKFIKEGTKVVIDLINLTKGKALILFTAKTDMEVVFQKLQAADLPYEILMQKEDSSQEEMLSSFRMNVDSVLLGTGAYWEGINIEGESLSNLIIFRLPFPVPDPIIEYKCSIEDDPLMNVNVPIMIIRLNQGIGRLIRSNADKGIVSIIDPRLSDNAPSKYKNIVWESLPIKNRTDSFDEIATFYHSLY